MYNYNSILFTFYLFLSLSTIRWIKIVGDPIKSKKSNVRDVSCVAILSGRMTGAGGQSIAYVRKKQYLCIVFRKGLKHVSVTFGVRTRCVPSSKDV